jgi:glucose/arabinose dehydrogenase
MVSLRVSSFRLSAVIIALAYFWALAGLASAQTISSETQDFRLVTVAEGLEHPWGLAFLPDGGMLVTERPGRLRVIRDGQLAPEPVAGLPEIAEGGQGGLMDVALDPDFADNGLIYLSYAAESLFQRGTEVVRARLDEGRLVDLEIILEVGPKSRGGRHFGSRLRFGPDGMLYVTAGERGDPDRAQDLDDLAGSVIRIAADGAVPPDNPFVGRDGVRPEIYSYGHRNPQGLAVHPETGALWAIEHGPRGGDELNILRPGANCGWPVITYGESYAGFPIGEGTSKPGMEQPLRSWVPSISPSGLAFYTGEPFPTWRGDLFLGALSGHALVRLELDGDRVVHEERLLENLGARIRDVRNGPDGLIYLRARGSATCAAGPTASSTCSPIIPTASCCASSRCPETRASW